ncbi:MAG: hypothetical protein KatS3mg129_1722 [Leptospiraceae bacterium]|nr:MAG: hypothetical protein KatS3mg129_1722 [Leptospiraceae bacterium]
MNSKIKQYKAKIKIIKEKAKDIFGKKINILIFGSRLDHNKKVGNINIFIETAKETFLSEELNFYLNS